MADVGLWFLVVVPALAGLTLASRPWRTWVGWAASAAASAVACTAALAGARSWRATMAWGPRLELTLATDGLAGIMAVLVPAIAAVVLSWVAATGGAHEPRPARLSGTLVLFVAAMELLVLADDLLTLLIAWELVAVCSWVLIGHRYDDGDRAGAARHAYLTTRVGDIGLFLATGAALAGSGSLRYDDLASASPGWLAAVAAGVVVAAAAKSAQLPFSPWLFSAMAGPSPVSALLHSATMVAAGAYLLARVAPSFATVEWFSPTVVGLGVATAIAGGFVAAASLDLKRALAASTSAQYGLILVAIGAGSTAAAGAHLTTHAVFKALLFLAAGSIAQAAGSLDLRRIRLGRSGLTVAFVIGAASLAAVPPLGGAWSKEEILASAAHEAPWAAAGVLASGALSAFYAARLVLFVLRDPDAPVTGTGRAERLSLAVLAAASVALGALWLPGAGRIVERVTGGGLAEAEAWELPASVASIGVALAAAWVLASRRRLDDQFAPSGAQRFAASWFGLAEVAGAVAVRPVLALARGLARIDDAVVDAGVRATAGLARALSRAMAGVTEVNADRLVRGVGATAIVLAQASRVGDERGVDRAVEAAAAGTVVAAGRARKLQTGLAHHYYLLVAGGTVLVLVLAAVGRT